MPSELVAERVEPEVGRSRPSFAHPSAQRDNHFAVLIEDQLADAYRLAAVILGDAPEAQDAVHDAAERARRNWSQLREPERLGAWFRRIVVNACRDRLRRRRRRRLVEIGRTLFEAEHPASPDVADAAAARHALARAFERLSADQRIVIVLRYEEDLTVPAIAAVLGKPEGTVKSRLHHALGRLRAAIEDDDR